jgi:hypothetical protein
VYRRLSKLKKKQETNPHDLHPHPSHHSHSSNHSWHHHEERGMDILRHTISHLKSRLVLWQEGDEDILQKIRIHNVSKDLETFEVPTQKMLYDFRFLELNKKKLDKIINPDDVSFLIEEFLFLSHFSNAFSKAIFAAACSI